MRDGELERLTEDHSLVEEMVREGSITAEEALTHPKRNIVTRALGINPSVEVDSDTITPYTGDRFVLCSDGLFNEVDEDRIASVLRRLADPADAANELVRLANEGGGRDNITVVVVDVVDDDDRAAKASAAGRPRRRPPARRPWRRPRQADARSRPAPARGAQRPRRTEAAAPAHLAGRRLRRPPARHRRRRAPSPSAPYARGTYYVGTAGDAVAIYKGKPDGVLWFDPTLEETTELLVADLPAEARDDVARGIEFGQPRRGAGLRGPLHHDDHDHDDDHDDHHHDDHHDDDRAGRPAASP